MVDQQGGIARGSRRQGARRRRVCTLIITHQCNLHCVYCYERFKSSRSMPLLLAQEVVLAEFDRVYHSPAFDELEIDLMGGEPLVRFDLVRELAEWLWSEPRPVPYLLFATTNGTLLTNEMKSWLRRNRRRLWLCLSLDGTAEMHATNRNRWLKEEDLRFFRECWPEQGAKMTLSRETLPSLAAGILFLQSEGFTVRANLGYGIAWDDASIRIYREQLDQLADHYLEHPEQEPADLLVPAFSRLLRPKDAPPDKWCGSGTCMATYDVDGRSYPCHLFTPLVLGEGRSVTAKQLSDPTALRDSYCRGCALEPLCPTCYGFNFLSTGELHRRDRAMCRLFKTQMLVACRLESERLRRKKRAGGLSAEDVRAAKGCLRAYESLTSKTAD